MRLPVVALVPVFQSAELTEGKRLLQSAHSTANWMALEYGARDRVDLALEDPLKVCGYPLKDSISATSTTKARTAPTTCKSFDSRVILR
jgi:hypothetical protein